MFIFASESRKYSIYMTEMISGVKNYLKIYICNTSNDILRKSRI